MNGEMEWTVSKSGVSVDAGRTRIRQEAGASRADRIRNARLIAAAPELFRGCILALQSLPRDDEVCDDLSFAIRKACGDRDIDGLATMATAVGADVVTIEKDHTVYIDRRGFKYDGKTGRLVKIATTEETDGKHVRQTDD